MLVPPALNQFFSGNARARGEDYAHDNRVRFVSITPRMIEATVRGTEMYAVRLAYERDPEARVQEIEVSCTCPFFAGGAETCKHMWATLTAAVDRGGTFLMAMEDAARGSIVVVPSLDDLSDELDRGPTRSWRPGATPARNPQPPTASPSRRFLMQVVSTLPSQSAAPAKFRYDKNELIYVFDLDAVRRLGGLHVNVLARQAKKSGGWTVARPAVITPVDLQSAPREDAEILSMLVGAHQAAGAYGSYSLPSTFALPTVLARILIPLIAKSGRAHVSDSTVDPAGPWPVTWDADAQWIYQLTADPQNDGIRLSGSFARNGETQSPGTALAAFDSGFLITRTTIAPFELPSSRALFGALLKTGSIDLTSAETTTLAEALATSGSRASDLPAALQVPTIDLEPIRRLSFSSGRSRATGSDLTAALSFDYDGTLVPDDGAATSWDAPKRRVVQRRSAIEFDASERLDSLGVKRRWDPYERRHARTVSAATLPAIVRALLAEGWHVEAEGKRFQRPGHMTMSVSSGIDWFDLQTSIEFSGEAISLTDVLAALKRGDGAVRLGDGSLGLLPEEWLVRYAPLAAMGEADGDRLRFRLPQTAILDALLAAQADDTKVTIDATFDAARQALAGFDRIEPLDPSATFHGELRPYQKEGLGWLAFLRRFGFGGCLADDMGLGKTVIVLAMLDAWRRDRPSDGPLRPSLVVVPRSLVHNWIAEAARFTPELRVRDCSHATRKANAGAWDDADVVIATYGTLRRDITELKDREFDYVILDEAQAIKNASTASAKAARLLRARHRLALSGTPIENHLGELWSLLEFLNPGMLGRSSALALAASGSRTVDPDTAALLSKAVRPFILRRTKAQVAPDLPPRTEQTIFCELESKQRTFYNSLRTHYRQALLGRIERVGLAKSKLQVLEALLRLRQAACHPGLIDAASLKLPTAKLDTLLPRLREVVDEGHKAIVFSQFTSFLAIVGAALEKEGLRYEYLDGDTKDRAAPVERFQTDPDSRLFLISLKAGGLGLNLTAAEYVFLLDPWWNPAVEAQAIDRAHRIGQTRHVFAYRLIARDTVEEKVLELQETKRSLADAILRADAGLIGQLGREDLALLLS